jgi:hypothetical protein
MAVYQHAKKPALTAIRQGLYNLIPKADDGQGDFLRTRTRNVKQRSLTSGLRR